MSQKSIKATVSVTVECGDDAFDLIATVSGAYWPPGRPARPTDIDPPDPEMIEDREFVSLVNLSDGTPVDCPAWLAKLILDNADDAIREEACEADDEARERAAEDRRDA